MKGCNCDETIESAHKMVEGSAVDGLESCRGG